VLAPVTRLQFGPDAPVPFFQRQLEPPRDLRELADILNVAANDLRMDIPARWAHDALGIPVADDGEQVVKGQSVSIGTSG
jgi:phage gp29-like protein